MSNPMYGQNRADNSLENISSQWKVLKYKVTVDSTGVTNGSAVVADGIPAYFQPVLCTVKNVSTATGDDMAGVAVILDVETSGQKLCTTLSGLAAGAEISCVCSDNAADQSVAIALPSSAKDILAEAAAFKAAAGKTATFEIIVSGWDMSVAINSALTGEQEVDDGQ